SIWEDAISASRSCCVMSVFSNFAFMISSALSNVFHPCEANNQRIIETARIIFPALNTNAFVFSTTVYAIFLNKGILYEGISTTKYDLLFILIILLRITDETKAKTIPSRYIPNKAKV